MILFWSCVKNLRLVIELWYLEEGFWVSVQGFKKKKDCEKKESWTYNAYIHLRGREIMPILIGVRTLPLLSSSRHKNLCTIEK